MRNDALELVYVTYDDLINMIESIIMIILTDWLLFSKLLLYHVTYVVIHIKIIFYFAK